MEISSGLLEKPENAPTIDFLRKILIMPFKQVWIFPEGKVLYFGKIGSLQRNNLPSLDKVIEGLKRMAVLETVKTDTYSSGYFEVALKSNELKELDELYGFDLEVRPGEAGETIRLVIADLRERLAVDVPE